MKMTRNHGNDHDRNIPYTKIVKTKSNNQTSCLKVTEISYEFREPFITTGYRHPNSSIGSCLRSLLTLNNNEMLNFWTHFVPFLFVFAQLVRFAFVHDLARDDFVWPLFICIATICFFLLMSALAHAFNCMSPIARHLCFIVDYMSISIYGLGSSIAYKAYLLKIVSKDERFFDHFVIITMGFRCEFITFLFKDILLLYQ